MLMKHLQDEANRQSYYESNALMRRSQKEQVKECKVEIDVKKWQECKSTMKSTPKLHYVVRAS